MSELSSFGGDCRYPTDHQERNDAHQNAAKHIGAKTAYSGKSNEIIIGIIAKAAAAGAGTPTKNDANIPAEVHRQAWC